MAYSAQARRPASYGANVHPTPGLAGLDSYGYLSAIGCLQPSQHHNHATLLYCQLETESSTGLTGCLRWAQGDDGRFESVAAVAMGIPAVGHPCAGPDFTLASLRQPLEQSSNYPTAQMAKLRKGK